VSDWLTPDDVAKYADISYAVPPGNYKLEMATLAVKTAVERRRSDLKLTEPDAVAPGDVFVGSQIWAMLVFQTRNAPSGFAGYGDDTTLFDSLGARRAEVLRMIGWRRPVAL